MGPKKKIKDLSHLYSLVQLEKELTPLKEEDVKNLLIPDVSPEGLVLSRMFYISSGSRNTADPEYSRNSTHVYRPLRPHSIGINLLSPLV
jgi:hypothetical protein